MTSRGFSLAATAIFLAACAAPEVVPGTKAYDERLVVVVQACVPDTLAQEVTIVEAYQQPEQKQGSASVKVAPVIAKGAGEQWFETSTGHRQANILGLIVNAGDAAFLFDVRGVKLGDDWSAWQKPRSQHRRDDRIWQRIANGTAVDGRPPDAVAPQMRLRLEKISDYKTPAAGAGATNATPACG